jgi:hypothetical protein
MDFGNDFVIAVVVVGGVVLLAEMWRGFETQSCV